MNKTSLYTDAVLLFFSFFSKTLASENERGAQERKIINRIFSFPNLKPLSLAVSKSPAVFVFYHARSTDFEEKIEGLWTG